MKETDGWVKIKKYTDGGKPVCGRCGILPAHRCMRNKWEVLACRWIPGPECLIWHGESKSEDPEDVFGVILVSGVEGHSIYINDHRICGSKPWGGGKVSKTWKATGRDIREAIGGSRTSGESKSDISALMEEIAANKETVMAAGPEPQFDADEPRYSVHITGSKRLLEKLADLIWESPPQEK